MRERMGEMQQQIQQFVSNLNTEISQRGRPSAAAPGNSLIPVIQIRRTKKGRIDRAGFAGLGLSLPHASTSQSVNG
jgi:hypothetical protein